MQVTTILGSPRKKGNTARVLGWAEEELAASGHRVKRINLIDSQVNGCLGCGTCQARPDEPGCVQKDDAVTLFEDMIAADAVVYASPLYCWGFSAQMKALVDRHFCLITGYGTPQYKSLLADKPVALLVTCAGPVEDNADLIQGVFDRLTGYAQCRVVGKHIIPYCTTPDAMGKEGREGARALAQGILRA